MVLNYTLVGCPWLKRGQTVNQWLTFNFLYQSCFWLFFTHVYATPLFCFRLALNAFPDFKSVGRIPKSRNRRPWYPRMTLKVKIYLFGLTKCTIYCKKMFLFLFLYTDFSMLLLCSFFKLKELFQVKNGLTTSLLFFFGNSKNVGRSDDAKRRKR